MAGFDEIQLDPTITQHATGGPEYATIIVTTASGTEQRIQQWSAGRLRWTLEQSDLQPAQLQTLIGFFRARGGRARGFRFQDWSDYTVLAQAIPNPYPGIVTQLVKSYTSAGITETRLILKPQAGQVTIYENGLQLASGDYSVDTTTGLVTFSGGRPLAGAVYTWSGQFDTPARFDVDHLQVTLEPGQYGSAQSIPLIELFYPAVGVL